MKTVHLPGLLAGALVSGCDGSVPVSVLAKSAAILNALLNAGV